MRPMIGVFLSLGLMSTASGQTETQRGARASEPRPASGPAPKQMAPRPTMALRPVILANKAGTNAYRMTRRNGDVYLISRYLEEGNFFIVHDLDGKKSSHLVDSIARIEPLDAAELTAASANYSSPGARKVESFARSEARTSARTTVRSSARGVKKEEYIPPAPPPDPPEERPVVRPSYSAGTTATGIPLHVGPRGGIYHFSKNGNKVYQKRK